MSTIISKQHEYTLQNPRCYYCNEEIWFHPKFEHSNGIPIPLNIERNEMGQITEHLCPPRKRKLFERRFQYCYRCGIKITFDKSIRSRNGRPRLCEYNMDTGELEKHLCRKSPGYRHSITQRYRQVVGKIPKASEDLLLKQEIEDWKFKERWK